MTIHLMRHFKVQDNTDSWLNSDEFNAWVDTYDTLALKIIDVDLPEDIELIYCSTLSRAKRTAAEFPHIETIYSDKLIEVGSRVFFDTTIKLQKYIWFTLGSILWYFNKLDGENRSDTKQRAKDVLAEILTHNKKSVLVISHGFFMKILVEELQQKSFQGEMDFRPKNGIVYTFRKDIK